MSDRYWKLRSPNRERKRIIKSIRYGVERISSDSKFVTLHQGRLVAMLLTFGMQNIWLCLNDFLLPFSIFTLKSSVIVLSNQSDKIIVSPGHVLAYTQLRSLI